MYGQTVTVITRNRQTVDAGNNIVWKDDDPEQVDNVLIGPSSAANSDVSNPSATSVSYLLYFPRSWSYRSLRGGRIIIDGVPYRVVGDPRPYAGGVNPTKWNLTVQVEDTRG